MTNYTKANYFHVWGRARRARHRLAVIDSVELRDQIADTAKETGLLSIWQEVFKADPDMLHRLHVAFAGTGVNKYDDSSPPGLSAAGAINQ